MLMRYTLKQLEYFVAAAECGSIKLAADKIRISAPSISTAIAHLEEEFGVQLFVRRHAQGLSLTRAGKQLAREARLSIRQAMSLYNIADELASEISGQLVIGCMVTLAPMIAPEIVRTFSKKHSRVELAIIEGSHEQLLEQLNCVSVDAALSYDLQFPDEVSFEPLVSLPPQVLLPAQHKLARESAIRLKQLNTEPLILLDLPYSRQYFASIFQKEGLPMSVAVRSGSQEMIRSMVANGLGYTITNVRPKTRTTLDGRKLVSIPLEGRHQPMKIGLATLHTRYQPGILNAFQQHCRDIFAGDNVPGMRKL